VFAVLAAADTTWYVQKDLSDYHLQSVIGRDCYRGTYGTLSLFTCPLTRVHLEPFATVSNERLLCVVEASNYAQVSKLLASSAEVSLLWEDSSEYFVVAGQSSDIYPTICSSSSEFEGYARNAYTVSPNAIHPSDVNALLGEQPQPLDVISDFIAQVTTAELQTLVTQLAFGQPNGTWNTRNSYGNGSRLAVTWALGEFQKTGASSVRSSFRTDMCDNIIAEFRGTSAPNEIIVLGSHLDSRSTNNTSPTQVAPGADDNGSGTAINILFARLVQKQGISFRRTVRLMTFCGEEQGLLGSRAIAQNYRNTSQNVVAMYNVDMVGWQPQNTNTTIAFMTGSTTPALRNACMDTVRTYLPGQAVGTTSACCSDQQAFFENNFPAMGLFETPTSSVVYPYYHQSTDLPQYVSFPQVALFAKAIYSCVLSSSL